MAVNSLLPPQTIPAELKAALNLTEDQGPATPSLDWTNMSPYWQLSEDLLAGWPAVKLRTTTYLPKHPKESADDYKYRLDNGFLTNIFADNVESLAAKPFTKECHIVDGSANVDFIGDPVLDNETGKDTGKNTGGFQEDVDGKGSHLHVFAHEVFQHGIASALDWIFVDYPKADKTLTAAEEETLGLRPYWYRIPALLMLEVQSARINGKQEIIYARFREYKQVRSSFTVVLKQRVRVIERPPLMGGDPKNPDYGVPVWTLWEYDEQATGLNEADKWSIIDAGEYSIGVIPLVPFVTGRRKGASWQFDPPMRTAADLQVKLYQQETGLENVSNLVNYPMLSASGVNLKNDDGTPVNITIGPHTILSAPPPIDGVGTPGKWDFISPDSSGMTFNLSRIDKMKEELRELGRQPLTAQSQNITVITSAFASQKANSAVRSWVIMLKDALENALLLTAMWMNQKVEPEVYIYEDFADGTEDDTFLQIQAMRVTHDISQKTLWEEAQRRGILGPDFDAEVEEKNLASEIPSDVGDESSDTPPNKPAPVKPGAVA